MTLLCPPTFASPEPVGETTTGGEVVSQFIEQHCRITKDSVAGKSGQLLRLRDWQQWLLNRLYTKNVDNNYVYRTALIGVPRKNGKSGIGSSVALTNLVLGPDGGEVYSCAADRDQARIVFGSAKRMVEMDPDLSGICKLYRDAIHVPSTGSVYRVLSSEAFTKEGLSPTCVVYDELHAAPNPELWDVMQLAMGARTSPQLIGITTAGVKFDQTGQESICYRLYQHGKRVATGEVDDPTFLFVWWEPDNLDADWHDVEVWKRANPGFGDLCSESDFHSVIKRTLESEFRTKRLNQFVNVNKAWLPSGKWEARKHAAGATLPEPDTEIVIGFDGSYSGDSTGLVGCTMDGHIFVIEAWEKPPDDNDQWRVPISEVEQTIRDACAKWRVLEIACDPYRWQRTMEALADEGLPIVEWPTGSPARMVPACAKFFDAVVSDEGQLTHDGDKRIARHIDNCVVKVDGKGPRIVKDHRGSPRKIDLAVCAVIAYDRAVSYQDDGGLDPFFL